ncbi:ferrochelatase [Kushneria phosphatilytica]|uniref:Ferrochelatase n=1 Tax=Kushneria phosphatilytica TaxID=657387 RepID=A0A1S1NT15_9GAMM|nr:ferrochelatase [Kushneria phosphatilytica]OHV12719.1 ferrochelatase [Kushneria phosphatilytica]QEL10562.1 ferrochelatase [Kushneria phosphatilytica]
MAEATFGVLLANLGTPDAPTPAAVRRYLAEFLWDRRVIDVSRPVWWMILNGIVLRTRPKKVAEAYASVWEEEGSPLLAIGRRQQRALKARLDTHFDADIPVELAMTYGRPTMEAAGLTFRKAGVERILVLPLYPQYSRTTTAPVFDRLADALAPCPHLPELRMVRDYHEEPGYIDALAASVREHWEARGRQNHLLMSYHGIPKRYANEGDPYPKHCTRTSHLLAERLGLRDDQWTMTYQSRFGREEWLKPYTDETLTAWGKAGHDGVDVICPAFAADCLETLEEISIQNREFFQDNGGGDYSYIPALNDREDHIALLEQLVVRHTTGW